MVWYSHLFQNFPQFIVIHTVKGFGIVNTAEIDVFLELSCFFHDLVDVGNLISDWPVVKKRFVTDSPGGIDPYLFTIYLNENTGKILLFSKLRISPR